MTKQMLVWKKTDLSGLNLVGHTRWKQLLLRLLNQFSFNRLSISASINFHFTVPCRYADAQECFSWKPFAVIERRKQLRSHNVAKNTLKYLLPSHNVSTKPWKNGIPSNDVSTRLWKNCISHNVSTAHCKKLLPSHNDLQSTGKLFLSQLINRALEKSDSLSPCFHKALKNLLLFHHVSTKHWYNASLSQCNNKHWEKVIPTHGISPTPSPSHWNTRTALTHTKYPHSHWKRPLFLIPYPHSSRSCVFCNAYSVWFLSHLWLWIFSDVDRTLCLLPCCEKSSFLLCLFEYLIRFCCSCTSSSSSSSLPSSLSAVSQLPLGMPLMSTVNTI